MSTEIAATEYFSAEQPVRKWSSWDIVSAKWANDQAGPRLYGAYDPIERITTRDGEVETSRKLLVDPVLDEYAHRIGAPIDLPERERMATYIGIAQVRGKVGLGYSIPILEIAAGTLIRQRRGQPTLETFLLALNAARRGFETALDEGAFYYSGEQELDRRGWSPLAFSDLPAVPELAASRDARFLLNAIALAGGAPVVPFQALMRALNLPLAAVRDALAVCLHTGVVTMEEAPGGLHCYRARQPNEVCDHFGRLMAVPELPEHVARHTGIDGEEAVVAFGLVDAVAREIKANIPAAAPMRPAGSIMDRLIAYQRARDASDA